MLHAPIVRAFVQRSVSAWIRPQPQQATRLHDMALEKVWGGHQELAEGTTIDLPRNRGAGRDQPKAMSRLN
ncbi:hypothetical protein AB4156_45435, partial [Cupriavidus sp. 2MCAB6]|uniref:hypothetical protein n=1 Tax=Cupriavidus sp. 2MCAB6 TaxID=3232981 RepID=UPI003F9020DC